MGNSVIADLVNELRRDISLGVLEPGKKLQIEAIRKRYGSSAPSVREALSLLTGEQYVTTIDQRGFSVASASVEELEDLTRVRAELEQLALRWSMEQSTREWRAEIVSKHHMLREVELEFSNSMEASLIEWDEANRDFHMALTSNCGSPSLIQLISSQYDLTRRYRLMAYSVIVKSEQKADWLEKSRAEHTAIKDKVLDGKLDEAIEVLRRHITKAPQNYHKES